MQVLIREMQPNEKGYVAKLFARSLDIIDRIVFQLLARHTIELVASL